MPSLHSQTLNPHIDFARTPFKVSQTVSEWQRPVIEIGDAIFIGNAAKTVQAAVAVASL